MSSVTNPHSEPPNHEELVAYLDGELAPEECRFVEERLASDAEYRQQLRDLDQAWEALNALPTTAVDDGFARTTIELACVAAEEDLSHRTALAAVDSRSRARWWIAGGVAAAAMGFVMVRALAVHRNNAFLADLPVIEQVNALGHVSNVDFLRRLSSANIVKEFVKDEQPAFNGDLADFTKASSASLAERREWVNSLRPEQKADLAERARAFEDLRQNPEEKNRLRQLANEISRAPDSATLQRTLIAYGQWLSRRHTAGEQDQLRQDFERLSADQQVDTILRMVQRENEQAAQHLSTDDLAALRREIFELAKEKKAAVLKGFPQGQAPNGIANMDTANEKKMALFFVVREILRNDEKGAAAVNRLMSKLSPQANEHWNNIPRWQRERRRGQLWAWIHDAIQTRPGPENLEQFFVDKLTNDQRQALLDKPRSEMEAELEQLYLKSELGIDDRWQPEFGEAGRGPRIGPGPPEGGRRGGAAQRRPDGPPPGEGIGPEGPPRDRFDRERRPGPRGMRPGDRPEEGRPGDDRGPRLPIDRPDAPPGRQPPPPAENAQPI